MELVLEAIDRMDLDGDVSTLKKDGDSVYFVKTRRAMFVDDGGRADE